MNNNPSLDATLLNRNEIPQALRRLERGKEDRQVENGPIAACRTPPAMT